MIITFCFVAIATAAASGLVLWPSIGPVSLLVAPFFSSAAVLVVAAFFEARSAGLRGEGQLGANEQAAAV